MATTIRDVAEAAGVSAMAVSKVLHGTGATVRVGAETAATIRRVAQELRYQPNHLARSFRQRKTNTIGLVFSHFGRIGDFDGYFSALLNGAMTATFGSDYGLTICPNLARSSNHGLFDDGRFDGLLWCKPDYSAEGAAAIERSNLPIVMMHAPDGSGPNVPRYCCDNPLGLRLAVDHLVGLGHRHIAFLSDKFNHHSAEGSLRIDSFRAALVANGLSAREENVLFWTVECEELGEYFTKPNRATAVITFSERHAVCLLRQAELIGVKIPEELSVIGFDSSAFCNTTTPRLTAINQPIEQMAFDAGMHLISIIRGGESSVGSHIYPCGLDVRDSTAPPSNVVG